MHTEIESLVLESVVEALKYAYSMISPSGLSTPFCCVLGVSGGPDSMVLMDSLCHCKAEGRVADLALVVCHVDHGLREDSAKEAEFVQKEAAQRGMPCEVYRFEGCPDGENLEAWARKVRYEAFSKCSKEYGAQLVLTAHHEADQAETLLWRLCSGRLTSSAHTISPLDAERRICRPLLNVSKADIDLYLTEGGIESVYDTSNSDLGRTRNVLRLEIMPLLRAALNPVLDRALSETATRLNEDEAALWARAEELFEQNRFKPVVLKKLSPALAWRFAGITAQRHIGPGAKRLSRNALCRAVALEGEGGASGPIDLGFGIAATWSGELGLRFETQSGAQAVESEFCETLLSPGKLNICHPDGTSMVIEAEMLVKGPGPFEVTQKQMQTEAGDPLDTAAAYFDADVLSENELVVRSWMAGDSMKVWKRGSRKVKKLFQERSLPQFIRLSLPVVEWGIDLIWIPGVARSEVAPVTDETTQVLKLSYRRE